MKGVLHIIHKHGHLELEILPKFFSMVKTFSKNGRLINAGNCFTDGPLITCMRLGNVHCQEANSTGRM